MSAATPPKSREILVDGRSPGGRPWLDFDDPALTTGFSVFETLRTYGGIPVLLERHLERLQVGGARMGLACPKERIISEVLKVIEGWDCDVMVRITLFGSSVRVVRAAPVSHPQTELACALRPWPGPTGLDDVKHGSPWVHSVRTSGADDVLWVQDGFLLEATTGNVLAVRDGCLHTPPLDGRILPGITRAVLLECAQELGIPIKQAPLSCDAQLDELYLCSSLKILAPICSLDSDPAPGEGPVGRRLREAFWKRMLRN